MEVRILHAADLHLDSPFEALAPGRAQERRREQRQLLGDLANLCNRERIQLVLLAGDLFDSAVSYYETGEALQEFFSGLAAQVVVAPGNHDYYAPGSPWATLRFGENVHIFQTPAMRSFEFPELGVRVWGAGFNAPLCPPLLRNFRATGGSWIELGVLHGELGGESYNPISPKEIAASGLHYLALGHVHSFSGIQTAGGTAYAYPGCPEGRGFDETGEKGVILGTVSREKVDLRFRSLARRRYEILEVDVTGRDPLEALREAANRAEPENVVRFILKGEYDGALDLAAMEKEMDARFFEAQLKSRVVLPTDVWSGMEENSLRGLFLKNLRERYDAAKEDTEREKVLRAVRYGLAALDRREEWRPR